jgi:hypothetical protein
VFVTAVTLGRFLKEIILLVADRRASGKIKEEAAEVSHAV